MADEQTEKLAQFKSRVQDEEGLYLGNPTDERVLSMYLYYAENDVDKAFKKLQTLYQLKAQYIEYYATHREDIHDKILQKGVHFALGNRDNFGRRIYIVRLGHVVYGEFKPQEMFQVDDFFVNLAMDEEETQKNGLVVVMDLKGMSWKLLRLFTPHNVRVSVGKMESVPLKTIHSHFINGGVFLNTVMQLILPFFSYRSRQMVFCHKNLESLHNHVSPSVLPEEYGGEAGPMRPVTLGSEYLEPRANRLTELLSYGYAAKGKQT